jgi:putative oxidoreductase
MRRRIGELLGLLERAAAPLQSPLLLAVRLYWGFQFAQTGWGKLHNLERVTAFFAGLGIPAPGINAPFIGTLEFVGGILLAVGLGSRAIALLLTGNMLVAYLTAHREALLAVFSNPGKFLGAAPYTFLFASLLVLVFGPGKLAVDSLIFKSGKPAPKA